MFLSIKMPKKKTKITYKQMMADILKPKKVAPSPGPKGVGGGVPEKVVRI